MKQKILVINTGSTSTKIALFVDGQKVYNGEVTHDQTELNRCENLADQYPYRKKMIENEIEANSLELTGLSAVAARGGTFGSVKGGAYLVNEDLLDACRHPVTQHASNLSAIIAYDIAKEFGCDAYIYDAVCTDEVDDIAKVTGLSDVKRRAFSHTLNTRAVAMLQAEKMDRDYREMTFIVAHLGGGISVNIHKNGRIIDLVTDDEGAMSPERAGKLNGKSYVDLCFSGKYDKKSMMKKIKGHGGLLDHLGTSDMREIEKRICDGDEHARFILEAMGYQLAKDIAALASVVHGKVDCIILTGGCANSRRLTRQVAGSVDWIAPVSVIPGAMEMEALANGVARVLDGKEQFRIFSK